jgi:hypothetical protein
MFTSIDMCQYLVLPTYAFMFYGEDVQFVLYIDCRLRLMTPSDLPTLMRISGLTQSRMYKAGHPIYISR